MTTTPPKRSSRAAWAVAVCAAIGLGFAARAAQQTPGAPGSPHPESATPPTYGPDLPPPGTGEEIGEPDSAEEAERSIEQAVREAEAEARATGEIPPSEKGPQAPAEVKQVPAAAANAVAQHSTHLQGLSLWRKGKLQGDAYEAKTEDGKVARLTVDPRLQKQMQKLLAMYKPLASAVVAIDPKTGKVLALAEQSSEGNAEGIATKALYPAASVFKIITGAALIEKGVSPDAEICYHGGLRGIAERLLKDSHLDRRCLSLSMALARSANVVFAKMAMKHLDADALRKQADRFLFNRPIFDQPLDQSPADIPDSGLGFARSAAGFGQVKLSPMHAAVIAAAVGNGGIAFEPSIVDSIDGVPVPPTGSIRVVNPETAAALRDMMKLTVTDGTATSSFRERRKPILGTIEVAGKTGSLSNHRRPFKDYSWFVGFAPADDPQIAVATVVVNGLKWKMHAPFVAREALRAYLVGGPIGNPPFARVKHWRKHRKKRT